MRILKTAQIVLFCICYLASPALVRAQGVETVGSLIASLGVLDDFISAQLGSATGDAQNIMGEAHSKIRALIQELSDEYKDNLNVTLSSIDSATTLKLIELQGSVNSVLNTTNRTIELGGTTQKEVISDLNTLLTRTTQSVSEASNAFVISGASVANIASISIVKTFTSVVCVAILLVSAVVAAFVHRRIVSMAVLAVVAVVILIVVDFSGAAEALLVTKLETNRAPYISLITPTHYLVGISDQRFSVIGYNLMYDNQPVQISSIPGTFDLLLDHKTNNVLSGKLASPATASPGNYKFSFSGPGINGPVTQDVSLAYPEERSIVTANVKISGSKTQVLTWSPPPFHIEANSIYGHDDGITRDDLISPPVGYTLVSFTYRHSQSLGDSGASNGHANQEGNAVRYHITSKHGPWHNRWRCFASIDVTMVATKGEVQPAENTVTISKAPVTIKRRTTVPILQFSELAKGDVVTVQEYTASVDVVHPNGTKSTVAQSFAAKADGDSVNVDGVILQKRGDTLLLSYP